MKKVLPRTFYAFVCVLLLSVSANANKPFFSSGSGVNPSIAKNKILSSTISVTAPADLAINTDPWFNTATNVVLGSPSFEKLNGVTYTVSNNAPSEFPIGTTKVTWTVSDNQGNTGTAIQNVLVTDMEKPYVERMGEISVVNDSGKCGAVVGLFLPYTFDNSGMPVSLTNNAPSYFPVGSTLIVWTATDVFGNSDTSTQLITVIDNEIPSIKISNVTAYTDPGKCGATVNLGTPIATDNCGVVSVTNNAPDFFSTGTTIVTWTVTDKVGYTNTTKQTVTVIDNEKPLMTAPATVTLKNTTGKCGALSSVLLAPAVTDNCGVASITNNAPALLPKGTTIVTWTATDLNGNTSSAAQMVVVRDAEAPVFSNVPADVTVACNTIPAIINPVVSDNCDISPQLSFNQTSTQVSSTSQAGHYNYIITRTWTAKDISGNTSTAKQVITVSDKTGPSLTVPANITVNNDMNKCGAVVKYPAATASDICGSPITISYSISSGSLFTTGTTAVTVTAKDVSGNTTTKSFTVQVNDTQKPVITAPADISLNVPFLTSTLTNLNLGLSVTSDNCGVASVTNNAPASFSVGTTKVTWTVTDKSGNISTDVQKITLTALISASGFKKNSVETDKSIIAQTTGDTERADDIKISVAPNPSSGYFTLLLQSKFDTPVTLKITDITGRIVEARSKLSANSSVQVGGNYRPGVYYAEMLQGLQHKVVQLIKVK